MRNRGPFLIAGLVLFALLTMTRHCAADVTFTGAGGGSLSWFNPKNWDQGRQPTFDDNALIAVPGQTAANPVIIDGSSDPNLTASVARLMVGDGTTSFLTIKSRTALGDGLRVGCSDTNHTGNGTVTQMSGMFDPGSSPKIGTTAGLSGTYYLEGGTFSVGDTSLYIGGPAVPGQTPGKGSFVISGGKFSIGSRVIFGNGGAASFTIIGSQADTLDVGDQFNEDGNGLVDLNVQIDKGGLSQINTQIFCLRGVTLNPSFAKGVTPYAGTWTVVSYGTLGGTTYAPILGKGIDPAHWSARLDAINSKLLVTYKP